MKIGENKCGGQGKRARSERRGKTAQGKAEKRRRGGKNGRNKRAARLGLKYTVSVSAGEGTLTDSTDIPVTAKYEGEDAKIVGGKQNEQSEFIVQDGAVVDTGEPVGFAGDFANAAKNGNEASITFDVVSYADGTADITMRCGNSYLMSGEEADSYYMAALQINQIADLTVNGEPVTIGDDVRLAATPVVVGADAWVGLYNVYSEFTFENVPLKAGINLVKLSFRWNDEITPTKWDESPSTMNIDWLNVTMTGADAPSGDFTSVSLDENFEVELGDNVASTVGVLLAEYGNGTYRLDPSEYNVKLEGSTYGIDDGDGHITENWIEFDADKVVNNGGKNYSIVLTWYMPTLVVTAAA